MVFGTFVSVVIMALVCAVVALPFLCGWLGYARRPGAALFAWIIYCATAAIAFLLFQLVENSPELRSFLGNEFHEALAITLYVVVFYGAMPSVLSSMAAFFVGRYVASKRKSN